MSEIQVSTDPDLDSFPDELPKITPGDHVFEVTDVRDDENKKGEAIRVVEMKCVDDDENKDRRHWENFNFKYDPAKVKYKDFIKACGLKATGKVPASEIIGCIVRATIGLRTYKDEDGATQQATGVKKFLTPA